MDLSVIIVTRNNENEIGPCLEAVFGASAGLSVETFVVDNGSEDKTKETIEVVLRRAQDDKVNNNVGVSESKPAVKTVWNDKNLGFAAAVNQGIAQSAGDCVLLLNPDSVADPYAFRKTVEYMRAHPGVGVMGAKIMNEDGSVQPSVRRFPTFIDQAVILAKMHNFFPQAVAGYFCEGFDYGKEQEVDQVRGAFFAISRMLLDKIGPLDQKNFFIWFEEVDYCRRAKDAGFKVAYAPFAAAVHGGGASFGRELSVKKQRWFNHSMINYFRKHGTAGDVFVLWMLSVLSLPLAAGVQLLKIKPRKYV